MGIFSKPKKEASPPDDQIRQVITKFQGWTNSYLATEINGRNVTLDDVHDLVEYVIVQSVKFNDEDMIQWCSKVCVAMLSATTEVAPVDVMAQVVFDGSVGSMILRKKYASNQQLLQAIETLGVASYKVSERHPKFGEVLQYTSENAQKLNGNG
jgi:hypothetical protein